VSQSLTAKRPIQTLYPVPDRAKGVLPWIRASLTGNGHWPADLDSILAADEGVLPWLSYALQNSGQLEVLIPEMQQKMKASLRQTNMLHLASEGEMQRLASIAEARGIRLMAFKGHAVARTLYPHAACRTTSDFDFLVDAGQLAELQNWLSDAGYLPTDPFAGTVWLGARNWVLGPGGTARFHADIHWDYTSRMYFRRRLGFEEIWAESAAVPCGNKLLRVPCPADNLVIACVHLAAFDPGLRVRLIWLLDIHLLMREMEGSSIPFFLERAQKARAVEACLVFGDMAAELGDRAEVAHVLDALKEIADEGRWRFYQRTLRHRALDLGAYWWRLPVGDKARFFGDMVRWIGVRS